jgi:integrase/recombinase XerD
MTSNTEKTTELNSSPLSETQESVTKVRRNRKIPKCIRPEEFKKLIEATPKKEFQARISFLLSYATGMRISEVMRCDKSHFRKDSIFIPESKYGVERIVPLPKGWKEEFFHYLPLKSSKRTIQRKFEKYSKKANLPSFYTFHSLRHGFATRLLESGVPINQVQMLMGHSDISTTGIYTKANPIDAIRNYEDLF